MMTGNCRLSTMRTLAAFTLMVWYMAAIFDTLQRKSNRILGGSVINNYSPKWR